MDARIADGVKSRAETVATALNALLAQLAGFVGLEVALVGYRATAGRPEIAARWDGPLAGRQFVPCEELAAQPLAVEQRTRKVATPAGVSEQTVPFPTWYRPVLGDAVDGRLAHRTAAELLCGAAAAIGKPGLLMHVLGDVPSDAADGSGLPDKDVLSMHAHLATLSRVPAILYPSAPTHLPSAGLLDLFHRSSPLGGEMLIALREAKVAVNAGARGLIANARLADLIRWLGLVKAYATIQPVRAAVQVAPSTAPDRSAESASVAAAPLTEPTDIAPDATVLLVLLLDRSLTVPAASGGRDVWSRLQEHANDLLAQLAKYGQGRVEVATVAYGDNTAAPVLGGALAGRDFVPAAELAAGVLRVDETAEKVSNGIGGLIDFVRKRPVYVDLPAAAEGGLAQAVENVRELLSRRRATAEPTAAVVLHLTRGGDCAALAALPDDVRLYHLVLTETPQRSLAYPSSPDGLDDPHLRAIWERTSRLGHAKALASRRPSLADDSRGMVVNGKFDVLLESLGIGKP